MEHEIIYIKYPAWAKLPLSCKLFGVGEDQIMEWRKKGYVLCRARNTSVQYRCKDIDNCLEREAKGLTLTLAK